MEIINLLIALLATRAIASIFEKLGIANFTAYIICGYLLGPQILNIINEVDEQLLKLSMITLFFYIGVSINLRVVKLMLKDSIRLSITGVLTTSSLVLLTLISIGKDVIPALIMAIALSNTATEVVVLTLNSLGIRSRFKDLLITSSFLDDLIAVGFIPLIEILACDYSEVLTHILKLALFTSLVVLIGTLLSKGLGNRVVNPRVVINLAIMILLIVTSLGYVMGIEIAFSAYLAGLSVGFLRLVRDPTLIRILRLEDLIRYLTEVLDLLLIPIFFLYVGIMLKITTIPLIEFTLTLIAAFIGKFLGCLIATPSKDLRERIIYGIAMNARGALEPTIALLALSYGLISEGMYGMLIAISTITSVIVPTLLRITYKALST